MIELQIVTYSKKLRQFNSNFLLTRHQPFCPHLSQMVPDPFPPPPHIARKSQLALGTQRRPEQELEEEEESDRKKEDISSSSGGGINLETEIHQ